MNYGALGSVIGHELTHGFSIMYERNEDDDYEKLWTNGTLEKRGEIVECIKNSYDDFSIEQGRQSVSNICIQCGHFFIEMFF